MPLASVFAYPTDEGARERLVAGALSIAETSLGLTDQVRRNYASKPKKLEAVEKAAWATGADGHASLAAVVCKRACQVYGSSDQRLLEMPATELKQSEYLTKVGRYPLLCAIGIGLVWIRQARLTQRDSRDCVHQRALSFLTQHVDSFCGIGPEIERNWVVCWAMQADVTDDRQLPMVIVNPGDMDAFFPAVRAKMDPAIAKLVDRQACVPFTNKHGRVHPLYPASSLQIYPESASHLSGFFSLLQCSDEPYHVKGTAHFEC
jgi:hypothetical protein